MRITLRPLTERASRSGLTPAALVLAALLPVAHGTAQAADPPRPNEVPPREQIVRPEVERRPMAAPRLPSNDVEVNAFFGTYSTELFGASRVVGVRLGYHVTEDVFIRATAGRTRISDELFRQGASTTVFDRQQLRLTYTDVALGFNVLTGEFFPSARQARPAALYVTGGLGNTHLAGQSLHALNIGFGARVFLRDSATLQLDVRDHIFALDVLGARRSLQNLEVTFGASFFF